MAQYLRLGTILFIIFVLISLGYNVYSTYKERDKLLQDNVILENNNKELQDTMIRKEGDFNNTIKIISDSIQQNTITQQKVKVLTNTIHETNTIFIPTPSERNETTSHSIIL